MPFHFRKIDFKDAVPALAPMATNLMKGGLAGLRTSSVFVFACLVAALVPACSSIGPNPSISPLSASRGIASPSHAAPKAGPQISSLLLLLPPRARNPVRFHLLGSNGCFSWAWDHHDLLHVQPLFNTSDDVHSPTPVAAAGAAGGQAWGSHGSSSSGSGSGARGGGCSTSALISSMAPYSGAPRTTAVIATDLLSGQVLRCEVRVGACAGRVGACAGRVGACAVSPDRPTSPTHPLSPSCLPLSPFLSPPLLTLFPTSPAFAPCPAALAPSPLACHPSPLAPYPLASAATTPPSFWCPTALGPPSLPCSPSILAYPQFLLTLNRYFLPSIPAFPQPLLPPSPLLPPTPASPHPCAHLLPPTRRRVLISGGPHLPLDPHAPRLAPPRPPPTCGLLCATWRPGIGAPPAARAPGGSGAAAGRRRGGARARDDLGVRGVGRPYVPTLALLHLAPRLPPFSSHPSRFAHPPLPPLSTLLSPSSCCFFLLPRPLPFITLFSPSPVSPPSQLPSPILPAVQLPSPSYAWATANASVASVHPSQGVVTALAQGATTLTATDVRVADHHQAVSIHVVTPGHVKIFLAPLAPLPGGNGGTGGEGEVCSGAGAAGGGGLPGAVACRAVAEPVASGGDTWHLVVGREYALWVQVFSHGWPSRPVLLTQADTLLLRFDHPPLWSVVGEDAAAVASLPAQAPPALEGGGGGGEERSRVVVVRGGQQGQGEVQAELRYREVQSGGKGREEKVVAVQAIRVCDPVLVHLPSPTTPASSSSPPPVDPVHVVHLPWVPQLDSAPPPLRQHLRLLASGGEQSHAL
ncbi:unnamed protein product [Closterium sp. Yama58-4]|nr:unnamed protein product [Closterium sp. Yama58-4]